MIGQIHAGDVQGRLAALDAAHIKDIVDDDIGADEGRLLRLAEAGVETADVRIELLAHGVVDVPPVEVQVRNDRVHEHLDAVAVDDIGGVLVMERRTAGTAPRS